MYHLDEVTCAIFADPVAARRAVLDLRADGLENRLDVLPRGGRAAGHHARTFERALFATGDAGSEVELALGFNIRGSADGVREVRVTAVDENVAVVQQRQELLDHIVHSLSCLDHHEHLARFFQIVHQFFKAVAADDVLTCGSAVDEFVHLFCRAVENRHSEALGLHIHDKVLAHDGKSD